ncbi:MAG: AtpZ/AtpI family protein [SAR324 cluster bacterium]|nr:AtpZ/AtpI family protein [SAR324 cluster bacterium]
MKVKKKGLPWHLLSVSYSLVLSIVLFSGLGFLADRIWLTRPIFIMVGMIIGTMIGFYIFIRQASKKEKNN